MLKVERLVYNSFQENTYVVYDQSKECLIVDPGCYEDYEKDNLVSFLNKNNLKPVRLIFTHGHIDHILGAVFISSKYNLKPEIHREDKRLMEKAASYGSIYGFNVEIPSEIYDSPDEGGIVRIGNSTLEILHLPGHSPGSIGLLSREDKFIILGDVLFKGSIGRTDLPGGDYDVLMDSIGRKLMVLDENTIVYSGHMESTTIGIEKRSNPFITEYFGTY